MALVTLALMSIQGRGWSCLIPNGVSCCVSRSQARGKKTLLGVFLLFAGGMALGNVPQLPDWTKEKVPARVENALGGSFLSVDPVLSDGNIRKVGVPDVKMGKDGKPTPESLKKVYDALSKNSGKGTPVTATYNADADAEKIEKNIKEIANFGQNSVVKYLK